VVVGQVGDRGEVGVDGDRGAATVVESRLAEILEPALGTFPLLLDFEHQDEWLRRLWPVERSLRGALRDQRADCGVRVDARERQLDAGCVHAGAHA